jgi:hypothetical protein
MCQPRDPSQRADFLSSLTTELGVSTLQARRLLDLSEAARRYDIEPASLHPPEADALLIELLDDGLCAHARLVAAQEGEALWRALLARAEPPQDLGPALLLAVALDARCAGDEAYQVLRSVLRPDERRRWIVEFASELAEDSGRPIEAWELLGGLGADLAASRHSPLRCLVDCAPAHCPAVRLPAASAARWLWLRARRWVQRPWADLRSGDEATLLLLAEGGPLAQLVREHGPLRGTGPMSRGLFGYLRARWRLLPEAERALLLRWLRTRWQHYTIVEATPYELVVCDEAGDRCQAGTEEVLSRRSWEPGDQISGWLLPTVAPDEHLFVLNTAPAAWFS